MQIVEYKYYVAQGHTTLFWSGATNTLALTKQQKNKKSQACPSGGWIKQSLSVFIKKGEIKL